MSYNNIAHPADRRPQSGISHPKLFILSWVGSILLLPFVVCFVALLWLYRSVIRVIAKGSGFVGPLTPYDCIFAVDSFYTRPYASNLTVLELVSRIDVEVVRRLFKKRVLDCERFSKLSCSVVEFCGYWFWRKLEWVRLNECVRVYYDDELSDFRSVDDLVREIVELPYTNELFNVFVIHSGGRSLIVFRIHHTVCDGYSFNKLIDKFVGLESKHLVKCGESWGLVLREGISHVWKLVELLSHFPLRVTTLYRDALTHTPNYYTQKKTSTTGQIRRTILPLNKVKSLRRDTSTHFASIGMSLMTGALQKLYDEMHPYGSASRPDRLSIMHSLPKPNHPLNKMCNHWGVGLFKVPFTSDPVERLIGTEEDFNEYMGLQFDRLLHMHMPVISLVPCAVIKWFFSINFGTSCGFTSVPGLFDKIAFVGGDSSGMVDSVDGGVVESAGGVEVAHMWKVFGLQWRQSAVAVAMYTYRGEASVSIYTNNDIVRTPQEMDRLMELFHQEFSELVLNSYNKNSITSAQDQKLSKMSSDQETYDILQRSFFRDNKLA